MPYLLMLVTGGFLTLIGLKGCEMYLEKEGLEKHQVPDEFGLKKTIATALVGGAVVVSSVYIVKHILKD